MRKIIGIDEGRKHDESRKSTAKFWLRRSACQIVAQLPDDLSDALEVLAEAKNLIELSSRH